MLTFQEYITDYRYEHPCLVVFSKARRKGGFGGKKALVKVELVKPVVEYPVLQKDALW